MYLAFTEECAAEIRKTGISVIEYKNCIVKGINVISYLMKKITEKLRKALDYIREKMEELQYLVKERPTHIEWRTNKRYQIVKFYSKCLKANQNELWKKPRVVVRSNC